MNEDQALAQQQLAQEMEDQTNGDSSSEEKTITRSTFYKMIALAAVFDIVSALINLIVVVGGFISTVFITAPGFGLFFFIYRKLGLKFHLKNSSKFGSSALIEAIPILNALPGFVLSVVLNLGPMIQKDDNNDNGGDKKDMAVLVGNPEQNKIQQFLQNNRS